MNGKKNITLERPRQRWEDNYVEGQPRKAVLAQTCMGEFFIRSVSDTIFTMLFLLKSPSDRLANCR
jgi:hypothetical protein